MPFFLFSFSRRTWSPFSSTKFFVLLAQVSSAAILFAENRYTELVFFKMKNDFFLMIFFLKLENQVHKFPGRTKIADFRKKRKIGSTEHQIATLDYFLLLHFKIVLKTANLLNLLISIFSCHKQET